MDPLNDLTSETHRLSSQARRAFLDGDPTKAQRFLYNLWNYLTVNIAGSAPEPNDSTKPATLLKDSKK